MAKTPWQYLGRKSHCWKAHFFKICFFVKYFRQRLLSLVNMGLHAAVIRLSPLIHEGEQRYKPYIVGDPRMVSLLSITSSLCDPPFEKILATPLRYVFKRSLLHPLSSEKAYSRSLISIHFRRTESVLIWYIIRKHFLYLVKKSILK